MVICLSATLLMYIDLECRFIWANWDVEELLQMKEKITGDPAMLKIGVTGVGPFSLPKLMERCSQTPVAKNE